ncbi:hypothetical protein NOGI109294_25285 [Nocardiopsis gilva]
MKIRINYVKLVVVSGYVVPISLAGQVTPGPARAGHGTHPESGADSCAGRPEAARRGNTPAGPRVSALQLPRASSLRERRPSLLRALATCVSTVRGERYSIAAISRLVRPPAARRTISCSRGDSALP